MVLQALSVNKFLLGFATLLIACSPAKKERLITYCADSVRLQNNNGIVLKEGKPFSGLVYQLFPDTKDTLVVIGYKEGREHGEWKQFYPGGKLKERRFFESGMKVGVYNIWWENGKFKLHCPFENGEYQGTYKEWNSNGVLIREMNYVKGHEEGSQRQFYDNGKIRSNYVMKNGKRYGLLGTKNCVNVTDSVFKE